MQKKLNKYVVVIGFFLGIFIVGISIGILFLKSSDMKNKNIVDAKKDDIYKSKYNIQSNTTIEEYDHICSSLSTEQDLLNFVNTFGIEQNIKDQIIQSFDGPKHTTENLILKTLGEIDESDNKHIRLQLSTLFIKLNELDSGESKNCDEIYSQYNK